MTHLENARVLPLASLFWLLGRFKSPNVPRKDVILLRLQDSGSGPLFSVCGCRNKSLLDLSSTWMSTSGQWETEYEYRGCSPHSTYMSVVVG